MAVNLNGHLHAFRDRATGVAVIAAAADAMAEALIAATLRHLPDLSMSRAGSSVLIEGATRPGEAAVAVGGAYTLADRGRSVAVDRIVPFGAALRTPWGPRASVRGSRWEGFGITEGASAEVFAAGRAAALGEIERSSP